MARQHKIPYFKIGRKYFFQKKLILDFIINSMSVPEKFADKNKVDEKLGFEKLGFIGIKKII